MKTYTNILGFITDPGIAERFHDLVHANAVEYLTIDREDTLRRRFRVKTDKGSECAIALPREQKLEDGSVLHLDDESAIVVRMTEEQWLKLKPATVADGLELGYFFGNLHWRVKFDSDTILIAIEGPMDFYLGRLQPFLDAGKAKIIADG